MSDPQRAPLFTAVDREIANRRFRAARALIMHHQNGTTLPVDFERLKQEMFGNPQHRISDDDLIRAAFVCAGMNLP